MRLSSQKLSVYIHNKLDLTALDLNLLFLSSLVPLFQSESKCETILMKISLICMKMKLLAELISYERLHTSTRFETEAQENSEMAKYPNIMKNPKQH